MQAEQAVAPGTFFTFHKLSLRVYLVATIFFANVVKGAALLMVHDAPGGEVHVDGAYVGESVRPENRKVDRIDRHLAENQNTDKRSTNHGELVQPLPADALRSDSQAGAQASGLLPHEVAYREDPRGWTNGRYCWTSWASAPTRLTSRD